METPIDVTHYSDLNDQKGKQMISRLLLCTPEYYDIEYSINPWMDITNKVNKRLAYEQWHAFIRLLQSLDITVEIIAGAPLLPDMVFAGDCGMMFNGTFLASNFKHPERQPERAHYIRWMKEHNIPVHEIPSTIIFEGLGDLIYSENYVVFGYGPRSHPDASSWIKKTFPKLNVLAEVQIKDNAFFHLAMAAGLIDRDTIVYFPDAFTEESQNKIKSTFKNAITVKGDDALKHFVCNNIVVKRNVIVDDCSKEFEDAIKRVGYNILRCNVSEFKKSGASLRCLVLNLDATVFGKDKTM